MQDLVPIRAALISVYHKESLEPLAAQLIQRDVVVYSTGGSADYLRQLGANVIDVADLTGYPSILGGRVKTLHPKVHGGILARRGEAIDQKELETYEIPLIDLVVVDLYPFEETVAGGATASEVIEKIDIGGIALIRGAAKNFESVACVPSRAHYAALTEILEHQDGKTSLAQRRALAGAAFEVSSHYDTQIHAYLLPESNALKLSYQEGEPLRYGENPHQQGRFYGKLDELLVQLHGKAISYNNLVDIEGGLQLVEEFEEPFFAIIKHTNPCGCAVGKDLHEAWTKALASDPVSAFGGILVCNGTIDLALANNIHELFFEVLIAKDFEPEALSVLRQKKNRILLRHSGGPLPTKMVRSALNGYLVQDRDMSSLTEDELLVQSSRNPTETELRDVLFGDRVVKHLKSNAIAIVKNGQLIGSGIGQTSRIDAIQQAMEKAQKHGFELTGAVLASDAFFPFADSVEMAFQQGIEVIVQPGGSLRDQDTINFCETQGMCLIFTGLRHFKH